MKLRHLALAGALLSAIGIYAAHAAGIFPGFPSVGNTTAQTPGPSYSIPMDTGIAGGVAPQTVLVPAAVVGNYGGTPRNYLGNGALNITNSNGTSTVTCAQNAAITTAALSADRWGCIANVAVGAGRTAIVTSSPSPPAGFTNSMKVFRTSGALTQPVCVMQEVPTPQATFLAGQTVTFSVQATPLAGLAADNGNVINLVIINGTGTDEGINASPTASPAITPAWTGINTVVNQPITLTTAALTFARVFVTATIPTNATEVGAMLCFTPTATGAGATDGFAWTGAQLEISPSPSPFEFQRKSDENADAQRYFYKISEGGTASTTRAMCVASTTSLLVCNLQFPSTMYKVPTMSYTNGFAGCTTVACSALVACTAIRTSTVIATFGPNALTVPVDCTSGAGFAAAGSASMLADNNGSGVINAWTGL